ncbi:hypothetical protein [Saccharopolyspora pogona]|uniref:hypothetical protein n=1 Tax=Saccharopolyspora pogona TaxID=333966 RepID=UPI001681FA89|nr:hypothetical protein [Saccharopolyspora pogona]
MAFRGEEITGPRLRGLLVLLAWSDVTHPRWVMVLANLQLGTVDEAEQWLALTELNRVDESVAELVPDLSGRAEISLARGAVDTGLRAYGDGPPTGCETLESQVLRADPRGLRPRALENPAVAVIAHAQHGRLDLAEDPARPDRDARRAPRQDVTAPGGLPDLRCAPAGTGLGGRRPGRPRRRCAGGRVGGAPDRLGGALPLPPGLPVHHVHRPRSPRAAMAPRKTHGLVTSKNKTSGVSRRVRP